VPAIIQKKNDEEEGEVEIVEEKKYTVDY